MYENQPNLGLELLHEDPDKCLSEWDAATLPAQMAVLKEVDAQCELKPNVHCRIYQLPAWSYINRSIFPNNKDVGKFLQISGMWILLWNVIKVRIYFKGTVMRISTAKLLEYQRTYICVKCKTPVIQIADYYRKYMIEEPTLCSNGEGCKGKSFVKFGGIDNANCKDYQEIKIQEKVKEPGIGSILNTMLVTLEDDLVNTCKPGDDVTIWYVVDITRFVWLLTFLLTVCSGIVKQRWGEFFIGKRIDIDITLKANYLQVDNICSSTAVSTPEVKDIFNTFWKNYSENPLLGRDIILASFCPQVMLFTIITWLYGTFCIIALDFYQNFH